MQKIYLLFGGTGPIGIHLSNILAKKENTKVFVTSRKHHESQNNLIYIRGNAKDLSFLQDTIRNVIKTEGHIDVVIDFMIWNNEDFKTIINIILPRVGKYVYLSSSRAFADTKGKLIKEESPKWLDVTTDKDFLETDSYAIPKAKQEKILQESGYTNFLIIRPYITYAENRLPLGDLEKEIWLYRALHGRTIVFSVDIAKHFTSLMYGKDVADAICSLILKDDIHGDSVNITSNEYLKWSEIFKIYTEVLKRHIPDLKIMMIPHSPKACDGDYQTIYDRMIDRRFDSSKLNKYVNTNNFTPMAEGLSKCLESNIVKFNYNKSLQNWKLQYKFDKLTHEHATINEFTNKKEFIKYFFHRYCSDSVIKGLKKLKKIIMPR